MARDSSSTLSQNLEVSSGLQQFRSAAQGSRDTRDNPFGPPPKPVAKEAPPATETPRVETIRTEPRPSTKTPKEPRNARRSEETTDEGVSVTALGENVTVPLSEALRDRSEELARVINRGRTVKTKDNRITRNTVIRVALQCFLDDFSLASSETVNSEEELLKAARSRRSRSPSAAKG